jgi:hypothetical protein
MTVNVASAGVEMAEAGMAVRATTGTPSPRERAEVGAA